MILPFMQNGDVKTFVKSKRGNVLEVTEYPKVIENGEIAQLLGFTIN